MKLPTYDAPAFEEEVAVEVEGTIASAGSRAISRSPNRREVERKWTKTNPKENPLTLKVFAHSLFLCLPSLWKWNSLFALCVFGSSFLFLSLLLFFFSFSLNGVGRHPLTWFTDPEPNWLESIGSGFSAERHKTEFRVRVRVHRQWPEQKPAQPENMQPCCFPLYRRQKRSRCAKDWRRLSVKLKKTIKNNYKIIYLFSWNHLFRQ